MKRFFLFLARPIGTPSLLECLAFAVVGIILARALGLGDSILGGVGIPFGVVYILGLLRLGMDWAAGGRGK